MSACTATVCYLPADPGVLHVLLARDADDTATIAIDLDVLTGGMTAGVARGQLSVWPSGEDDVVRLGLRGPHHAVMELPRPALAAVLADLAAAPGRTLRRDSQ